MVIATGQLYFPAHIRVEVAVDAEGIVAELLRTLIIHGATRFKLLHFLITHLVAHLAEHPAEFPYAPDLCDLLLRQVFNHITVFCIPCWIQFKG